MNVRKGLALGVFTPTASITPTLSGHPTSPPIRSPRPLREHLKQPFDYIKLHIAEGSQSDTVPTNKVRRLGGIGFFDQVRYAGIEVISKFIK
jgi:hypothetical protein